MKYCYLCHEQLNISVSGTISYSATVDAASVLYACAQCVDSLGVDQAFNLLEEHYEHRASLQDTLSSIDSDAIRRAVSSYSEE